MPISTFATTVCPPSGLRPRIRFSLGHIAPRFGVAFQSKWQHYSPTWRLS